MQKSVKNQKGFTLIEIAISLFIVSVVILIYGATSSTAILNRNAKHQQVANRIAASAMEDLRATPFASLPSSTPLSDSLISTLPSGQGAVTVSDINADTKQLTVTVSWKESGSYQVHSVNLTTLKTKQGL